MAYVDFTTGTENDPSSKITVTSTKVDWAALPTADAANVYKDYTADHFGGNYEHLWENYLNSSTTNGDGAVNWGLTNLTDLKFGSADDYHAVLVSDEGSFWCFLREHSGSVYQDYDTGLSYGTLYYMKTKRDEAVGTYGTLYNYVYSDSGRTTLVASQTITLHENANFRYLYGLAAKGSAGGTLTGYTQNFDIQEGASSSIKTVNGLAKASVKTVNGLAIASIKTINGLA